MEEEWGHALVHESGHALMATLQEILCHGVYYQRSEKAGKFCTLIPPNPVDERTKKDYLFLAAGSAAEKSGSPPDPASNTIPPGNRFVIVKRGKPG